MFLRFTAKLVEVLAASHRNLKTINLGKSSMKPMLARGLVKELELITKWNLLEVGRITGTEFVESMCHHEDVVQLGGRLEIANDNDPNEIEPDEEYSLQEISNRLVENAPLLRSDNESIRQLSFNVKHYPNSFKNSLSNIKIIMLPGGPSPVND